MMDDFKSEIRGIMTSSIMSGTYFDVTKVSKAAEANGVDDYRYTKDYIKLSLAHCISWKEMSGPMKVEIERLSLAVIFPGPKPEKKSFFKCLFN